MREIKFRAWDKQDKRMIVDKQDFIPLIVTNKSVFKLDPTSEKDRWIEIDKNRFELMQSTGLKDKNGVEIYEYMELDNQFEVSFSHGSYILTNISNGDIMTLHKYIKDKNGQVKITREYTKI